MSPAAPTLVSTSPRGLYEEALAAAGGSLPPARPPRPSAAVIPWRFARDSGRLETFWLQRGRNLPFMAGWHAFPGGALERSDAGIELAGSPLGAVPGARTPGSSDPADESDEPDLIPGIAACALRELAEETGAKPLRDGAPDAARLTFAGRWQTPPFAAGRFDNRFFLLRWLPEDGEPRAFPPESESGEWIEPARALARVDRGEALVAPPIVHILRVLTEEGAESAAALRRLCDTAECNLGLLRRIEFRRGVLMFPLRAATLPPATHTNCFLLGTHEAVLIDPGSPFPATQSALLDALAASARTLGRRPSAIWISHHHPDHVAGVEATRRALALPVLAHRDSAAHLRRMGIHLDGELHDDQLVTLAGGPGEEPFRVRILHTPGHARGHLAFAIEGTGDLLAGDLVAGFGTIVIDPPEGEMSAYLDSLARLRARQPRTLFVSHGAPFHDGSAQLDDYHRHRLDREAQILAAWSERSARRPEELVALVYPDLAPAARPLAERQVKAHLIRLAELGRITP